MQGILGHPSEFVPVEQVASESNQKLVQVHAEVFQVTVRRDNIAQQTFETQKQ